MQAKYSVGDKVEVAFTTYTTTCTIKKVEYSETARRYYYTVNDGDRYNFQCTDDDIIKKY